MCIYQLLHKRLIEPPDVYDSNLIGFFDSIKNAQNTIDFYSTNLPGFKDYPKDFIINKKKL